jgi:hypothetical protein
MFRCKPHSIPDRWPLPHRNLSPQTAEGPLFYREACPPLRSGRRAINYLMGRSCLLLRNKVMGLWLDPALKFSRLNNLFQNEAGSSSRQHACFASLGGTGLSATFFPKESGNKDLGVVTSISRTVPEELHRITRDGTFHRILMKSCSSLRDVCIGPPAG